MKKISLLGVVITTLFGLALAAPPSAQQEFDAASAAYTRGELALAKTSFMALERRLAGGGKSSAQTLAIVRLRLGVTLQKLGEMEEALTYLTPALTLVPDAENFKEDLAVGWLARAHSHEILLDYSSAVQAYQNSLRYVSLSSDRVLNLFGLTRTQMFSDSSAALKALDEAAVLLKEGQKEKLNKDLQGQLLTLRGRILLNRGEHEAALKDLREALQLLGGLTVKVSLSDIAVRSDLAIVYLLLDRKEQARKYLAYSASGLVDGINAAVGDGQFELPICDQHIKPDDFVVVQFGLSKAGVVYDVIPIYASRQGLDPLPFARLARKWEVNSKAAAKVDPFFASKIRLQLSCTNKKSERPTYLSVLKPAFDAWARQSSSEAPNFSSLTRTRKLAEEALVLAEAKQAPPQALAYLRIFTALWCIDKRSDEIIALRDFLSRPKIQTDLIARSALTLQIADRLRYDNKEAEALRLFQAVANDATLPDKDSLKIAALLGVANLEAGAKRFDLAQAAFARTGLTESECALVDAQPAMKHSGFSGVLFPNEARNWGFGGFVRMEFDIDAAGKPVNLRAVMAYPSFVFIKTSIQGVKRAQYAQSYRPGNSFGCTSASMQVRYKP